MPQETVVSCRNSWGCCVSNRIPGEEIVERHSTLETANTDLAEIQTESETRIEERVLNLMPVER